jgi:hypothetical protein
MSEWIPIKYREMTEEEKQYYADQTGCDPEEFDYMFDCPLPEDGEEVLVNTPFDYVGMTTFYEDSIFGNYFEDYEDMGDLIAWMHKPAPYKGETHE